MQGMDEARIPTGVAQDKRYDAFISYSHAADNKLAPSLQTGLQRLAKPWYSLRAMRVFRDETDLTATPEGWTDIQQALYTSRYFLLLASREGARSKWVSKEVEYWLEAGRLNELLIVLTDGVIVWEGDDFDWKQTNALPRFLAGKFKREPFWVDLRWAHAEHELSLRNPEFLKVVAKLSAPVRGVEIDTLISEDHRQHKRTMQLAYSAVAILAVLLIAVSGAALYAVRQERIAIDQRNRAIARQLAAQAELIRKQRPAELTTSVLLAIQSMRIFSSLEGEQTLRQGFMLLPTLVGRIELNQKVLEAVFSPDGSRILTRPEDCNRIGLPIVLVDTETSKELARLEGQDRWVSMAFQRTSGHLLAASPGSTAIWNENGSLKLAQVDNNAGSWSCWAKPAVLSDSGLHLVTLEGKHATFWDIEKRESVKRVEHEAIIRIAAIGSDGKYMALADDDNMLVIWEIATGKPIARSKLRSQIQSVVASETGDTIAVSTDLVSAKDPTVEGLLLTGEAQSYFVHIWDAKSGREIARRPHATRVTSIAVSRDGKYVATAEESGKAWVWQTSNGKLLANVSHNAPIANIALSPDGRYLATASVDKTTRLWSVRNSAEIARISHEHPPMIVTFSPNGGYLAAISRASGYELSELSIWKVKDAPGIFRIPYFRVRQYSMGQQGRHILVVVEMFDRQHIEVTELASGRTVFKTPRDYEILDYDLSPDENRLAVGYGWKVRVWQISERKELSPIRLQGKLQIARFAPDNRTLVTASNDNILRVWDTDTGELLWFADYGESVRAAQFRPSGTQLAVLLDTNVVELWDSTEGKQVARLPSEKKVIRLAFDPTGMHLVTVTEDGAIIVRSPTNGRELCRITTGTPPRKIGFDAEGKRLAFAGRDQKLRLYDLSTANELAHSRYEGAVADFSPDARYLATLSGAEVQILDIASGHEIARIDNGEAAFGVLFTPEGERIVVGPKGRGKTVNVWEWNPDRLIDLACGQLTRNLSYEEWRRHIGDTPYSKTCENLPTHPSLARTARKLGRAGDIDAAVALLRRINEIEEQDRRIDVEREQRKFKAHGLVQKAQNQAKAQKVDEAIALFEKAVRLDPNLDIDPPKEARKIAARSLSARAKNLAKEGDVEGAVSLYRKAKKLDPDIVSDPSAEAKYEAEIAAPSLKQKADKLASQGDGKLAATLYRRLNAFSSYYRRLDPEEEARLWHVKGLLKQAKEYAWHGQVRKAFAAYEQAQTLDPELSISSSDWDRLCWNGSLFGKAVEVIEACERAVDLDPGSGLYGKGEQYPQESRGLARAMTGNIKGAIEDFEIVIERSNDERMKARYQRYIEVLRAGSDPFTEEEIDKLLKR